MSKGKRKKKRHRIFEGIGKRLRIKGIGKRRNEHRKELKWEGMIIESNWNGQEWASKGIEMGRNFFKEECDFLLNKEEFD